MRSGEEIWAETCKSALLTYPEVGRAAIEQAQWEVAQPLLTELEAALRWIDAVPADVVASLPSMPGFDRDHTDALIQSLKQGRS